jgi:hypothetical protein
MAAVFRHVNGNMQDDAIYAADLVMQISGLHKSSAQYATRVSEVELDAECWYLFAALFAGASAPLCSVSGTCLLVACWCSHASVAL